MADHDGLTSHISHQTLNISMPPDFLTWIDVPIIVLIGLLAGTLGGMLGVGGSVIMIPALTILLGRHQQLYQASAMIINVVVAVPAALRHRKAGAMVPDVLIWMMPAALVFVLLGVWLSNLSVFNGPEGGIWLGRILAAFLVYVVVLNVIKIIKPTKGGESLDPERRHRPVAAGGVGGIMGAIAGLLGIGGGAIAVPLQQVLLKLPLRNCIANSTAVICVSAGLGAVYKNLTIGEHYPHGGALQTSLIIAAILAPTAFLGGRLGASLTHRLPTRQVRAAFVILMIVAAYKMAAIGQ